MARVQKLEMERIGNKPTCSKERGMMHRIIDPDTGDELRRDVALVYHKPMHTEATNFAQMFCAAPRMRRALERFLEIQNPTSPDWSKAEYNDSMQKLETEITKIVKGFDH